MPGKRSLLLVDDEAAVRLSFKRDLADYYEVADASCSRDALALLADRPFDLLISDLAMPDGDGLFLLKRAKELVPELCVMLISGYSDMEAVIEAMRAGADDFLLKPCEFDELLFRIDKTLRKRENYQQLKLCETIVSASDELIALLDPNGVYREVNEAYLRGYCQSRDQIIGARMPEVIGKEVFDMKIEPHLSRCLAGKATVCHQDFYRLDGLGERTMYVSYYPVLHNDRVISVVMTMSDVTEMQYTMFPVQKNEERLRLALEAASEGYWDRDLRSGTVHYDGNWLRLLGYEPETLQEFGLGWEDLLHPEDREIVLTAEQACLDGTAERLEAEFRLRTSSGEWQWLQARGKVVERDQNGAAQRFIGTYTAIDSQKNSEDRLREENELLQKEVAQQAAELKKQNSEISAANTALQVLLKRRQQDKGEIEERLSANVMQLLEPMLQRLRKSSLSDGQIDIINEIETLLQRITSSFVTKLSALHNRLTPTEIQVAHHVKHGKSTKEIADILSLAPETVNVHRKKIRKKLGISNKASNLRTILSSLEEN